MFLIGFSGTILLLCNLRKVSLESEINLARIGICKLFSEVQNIKSKNYLKFAVFSKKFNF